MIFNEDANLKDFRLIQNQKQLTIEKPTSTTPRIRLQKAERFPGQSIAVRRGEIGPGCVREDIFLKG